MATVGALGPIVFLGGLGTTNTFHSINKNSKETYVKHRIIQDNDLVEGTGTDLIELTLDMHFHGPYTLAPSLAITALESVMGMRIPLPLIVGRVPVGRAMFTLFVIESVDSRMTTFVGSGLAVADVSVKLLEYPNPLGNTGPLSALGGALPGLSNIIGGLNNIAGMVGAVSNVAAVAGGIPGLSGIASQASNVLSSVTGGITAVSSITSTVQSAVASLSPGGISGVITASASTLQGAVASLAATGKATAGTIPKT